ASELYRPELYRPELYRPELYGRGSTVGALQAGDALGDERGRPGELDVLARESPDLQCAAGDLDGPQVVVLHRSGRPEARRQGGGARPRPARPGLADAAFVHAHPDVPRSERPDELDVRAVDRRGIEGRGSGQVEPLEVDLG